jgi:hypothetical protein
MGYDCVRNRGIIFFQKKNQNTCEIKKNHYFCTRFERQAKESEDDSEDKKTRS